MNILSKDILPLKTSQKFSSVLEPYAGKVASTVLRRECHCEVMFLSDSNLKTFSVIDYKKDLKYKALNENLLKVRDKYGVDIIRYASEELNG